MSDDTLKASSLFAEGRFQAALAILRQRPRTTGTEFRVGERLLHMELLERTGNLAEARAQAAVLNKHPKLTEVERVRCLLVDGLVSKQLGHLEKSAATFLQAYRISEGIDASEIRAWCQLRFLGVSADLHGRDLDEDDLSRLKANVERAAVPAVSIAHQVFLAEYLAKRGHLVASEHHADVARSLLGSFPNYWLRGLLSLHESCLFYLKGQFLDALEAARLALESSRESGHPLTGVIALADMAAAYLAVGQAARATTCLSVALSKARREEQVWGLLIETLAEAQLVDGDLQGCASSLTTARELSARHSQLRSAWHRDWNLRTEARLFQRLGRWRQSLDLIRASNPKQRIESPSFPRLHLGALEALALTRLQEPDRAHSLVRAYLKTGLDSPRPSQGVTISPSVAMLATGTHEYGAVALSVQALRVVGATGETSSLVEVVDQLLTLAGRAEESLVTQHGSLGGGPVWRPTRVICHLETVTSVLPEWTGETDDLAMLHASLVDLSANPISLGEEALRYLVSRGWVRSGAVLESSSPADSPVITFAYPNVPRHSLQAEDDRDSDAIKTCLGTRQSKRYELRASPTTSARALSGCHGLLRIVSALQESRVGEQRVSTGGRQETPGALDEDRDGIFRSPAMLALLASAKRVSPLGITVLLTGESGTGKEVIARSIHRASGVRDRPFIAFNCATVPRDMVDSQLFGYRRGAFTGAVQGFKGVINAAEGGTLLLDEVGELPLESQPKFLRFLDTGEVQALGEAIPRRTKVRVIAATNADLEALVSEGRFREDLFYRLNVVRFRLPPLRERREEIVPLIEMLLARYALQCSKPNIRLSEAALEHLLLYRWPGNVRELSHEIYRLVALGGSDSVIDVIDLDTRIRGTPRALAEPMILGGPTITIRVDRPLAEIAEDVERAAIAHAMEGTSERLDIVAERLGLSRKGLYLKRQRLGFK